MSTQKITYLALLRGINVGGNNIIKMVELKKVFEEMGFSDVLTYIQSGNVTFKTAEKDMQKVVKIIEEGMNKIFKKEIRVVVITQKQLEEEVKKAPKGFGSRPETYRYDVIFLKAPLSAQEILLSFEVKEGVDKIYAGKAVIYFSRLIEKATQSRLSKIVMLPVYKQMTIRNWNTTTKLLELMKV